MQYNGIDDDWLCIIEWKDTDYAYQGYHIYNVILSNIYATWNQFLAT